MILSRIDAIVFDLDGTLVNTEHIHKEAWLSVLPDYGIEIDAESYIRLYAGRPGLDIAQHQLGFAYEDALALMDVMRARFWALAPGRIHPLPGLAELLERFIVLPKAIETSARRADAMRVLDVIAWRDRFDAIVTVDDVTNGKPHPEPFLAAASGLGVDPAYCLAFEDAPTGLRAAKAAGMFCIGIGERPEDLAPFADLAISSYGDPELEELLTPLLCARS